MRSRAIAAMVLSVVCMCVLSSQGLSAVRFDGCTWYHSEDPSRLALNDDHQLVWIPKTSDQITVKLPEMDLSNLGDVANVVYMFKADGIKTGVPSTDPTLLSGTGDMRIGLFDSNGKGHISRGLPVEIEREHSDAIPGKFMKRTKANDPDVGPSLVQKAGPYGKSRDLSGFGLKLGEWTKMILHVERTARHTLVFSVTLNGTRYLYIDDEADMQPKKIDAMAMYFPNPNKYTSFTFAGCHFSCRSSDTDEPIRTYISNKKKGRPDLKK
jgi:hypothetical protein